MTVDTRIIACRVAQCLLNYVIHPVSFQSWVSCVDSACIDLTHMVVNAIALLPAAMLAGWTEFTGGIQCKPFNVRTLILNPTVDLFVPHPDLFQSSVSFVDFAYTVLVLMAENAAARLPAAVLGRPADSIGGTEYKAFNSSKFNPEQPSWVV